MSWIVGQEVDHDFFIVEATEDVTKGNNPRPYLSLDLKNKHIECNSKLWDYDDHRSKDIEKGCYVHIKGDVKEFNGRPQVKIREIEKVAGADVDYGDIYKVASTPPIELKKDLMGYLSLVKNETLRKMNDKILVQARIMKEFYNAPAATRNHHDCVHGLMEHTVSMMGAALALKCHYRYLNIDLLITGCLWHDLGKTVEIGSFNMGGEYSTKGKLLGHMNISLDIVTLLASELDIEEEYEIDFLRHMIISHHGRKEYGSAVIPGFPEAQFLSIIDSMDAISKVMHEKLMEIETDQWTARRSNTLTLQTQMIRHKFFDPTPSYFSRLDDKFKGVL